MSDLQRPEEDCPPGGIAQDVLRVLSGIGFFEALDDRLCPRDPAMTPIICMHTFGHSIEILKASEMSAADVEDVLAVLRFNGACCDCEVLYNVAEEGRLKAKYWKQRASQRR